MQQMFSLRYKLNAYTKVLTLFLTPLLEITNSLCLDVKKCYILMIHKLLYRIEGAVNQKLL